MKPLLELRDPRESDWEQIAQLADVAVSHLEGAPTQEEWVRNRRSFGGPRRHHVALVEGEVAGYAGIEASGAVLEGDAARLFLVTAWTGSLAAALALYDWALGEAVRVGVTSVWMREYASDRPLLDFFAARGFEMGKPYEVGGFQVVNVGFSLGGRPRMGRADAASEP
jgi:hypothetical protein